MPLGLHQTFTEFIQAHGFAPPKQLTPGRLHRIPAPGKSARNTSGWCLLFPDEQGGVIGSWTDPDIRHVWQAFDDIERGPEWHEHIARAMEEAAKERLRVYEEVAATKAELWEQLPELHPSAQHAYLQAKGVKPWGARLDAEGRLVLKLRDIDGKIWNTQTIDAKGGKYFGTGGRKKGLFYPIKGELPITQSPIIVLCEGFSTGASLREITGYTVIVAFDCGNLLPVAQALRERYPDKVILVGADDDWQTPNNPGKTAAQKVADALYPQRQGTPVIVALPAFGQERERTQTDFNDMHQLVGIEPCRNWLRTTAGPRAVYYPGQAANTTMLDQGAAPAPADPKMVTTEDDEAAVEAAIAAARNPEVGDHEWPQGEDLVNPFDDSITVSLPLEDFPPALAGYAAELGRTSGFDEGAYAITLLAAASSLIDQQAKMRCGPMSVPAFFWLGLVAPSGGGKSPVLSAARDLVQGIDHDLVQTSRDQLDKWRAKMAQLTKEEKKDGNAIPAKPLWHQRLVGDTTVEALADLLKDNPHGVLMLQDEITELVGRMDTYAAAGSGGGGKDRGVYLRSFDGGRVVVNRRNLETPLVVENFSLAIVAGVQPEKMAQLYRKTGAAGADGLYQRFMLYQLREPGPVSYTSRPDAQLRARAEQLMRDIHTWTFQQRIRGAELAMDAIAPMERWHQQMRDYAIRMAHQPRLAEHLAKWPGFTARIAFALHAIECVEDGYWMEQVTRQTVEKAIRISEALLAHSEALYGVVESQAVAVDLVKSAADLILGRAMTGHVARSKLTSHATHWRTADTATAEHAIDLLIEFGWLRDDTPPVIPGKRGRRSKGLYAINPFIHEQFRDVATASKRRRKELMTALQARVRARRGG